MWHSQCSDVLIATIQIENKSYVVKFDFLRQLVYSLNMLLFYSLTVVASNGVIGPWGVKFWNLSIINAS
jgi:hypothetical protein